jgi:hypothetical protein
LKNNPLLLVLPSFSAKERRLCRQWLEAPLHNSRQDVRDLYAYLWVLLQQKRVPTKQLLWPVLYPNTPYNDAKMRQVIHHLWTAVEEFVLQLALTTEPILQDQLRLQAWRDRQLPRLLDKTLAQSKKRQQKRQLQNWQYWRQQYHLERWQFDVDERAERSTALNVQELSDAFDLQYFTDKLRLACRLYARLVVFKMEYQPRMLSVVLEQVAQENYQKIPAIGVYYHCYLAMTEPEAQATAHFDQLLQLLQTKAHYFPAQELRELYLLAINYTIKQFNTGTNSYLATAYELYQRGIEGGYLLEQGCLTPFTYTNVVSLGLTFQDFAWTETFIHEYKDRLTPADDPSIFRECLAKWYYAQQQYAKAQALLAAIQVKDILRLLSCKFLLARIYYETDEWEALESLLGSLQQYLRRKEVVGYHKENYQNSVYFLQQLLRLNPFDSVARKELLAAIKAESVLTWKAWFVEQLQQ